MQIDNTNPTDSVGQGTKKLTRKEKRVQRQAQLLQVQAEEYAMAGGVPPTLMALQEAAAENHAAPALHSEAGSNLPREGDKRIGTGLAGPGRPSEYTEEQADQLCAWIAGGGSLRAWCREHGRAMDTVYRWMRQDARFHARYAQAHEDRADTLADEMIEIADDSAVNASIEGVAAAKLRVETRRFIASKLRPQKWGDKQVIEHQGAVSIRIGLKAKPTAEAIDVTPKG